jgi:hypothetical protein
VLTSEGNQEERILEEGRNHLLYYTNITIDLEEEEILSGTMSVCNVPGDTETQNKTGQQWNFKQYLMRQQGLAKQVSRHCKGSKINSTVWVPFRSNSLRVYFSSAYSKFSLKYCLVMIKGNFGKENAIRINLIRKEQHGINWRETSRSTETMPEPIVVLKAGCGLVPHFILFIDFVKHATAVSTVQFPADRGSSVNNNLLLHFYTREMINSTQCKSTDRSLTISGLLQIL